MIVEEGIRVRVVAPDAPSAFLLARRLVGLHPSTLVGPDGWAVELVLHESDDEPTIERAVRGWLRESALAATTIEYDGGLRRVPVEV
jgi:hypothetical protein